MASITHNIGKLEINYDTKIESLSVVSERAGQWTINIIDRTVKTKTTTEQVRNKHTFYKTELPNVDVVINFIKSKPNFEHDNAEIQEHFLGRILESRGEDKKLYFSFANLIRKAKDVIEEEFKGKWDSRKTRKLANRVHVKVFEFIKDENNQSSFIMYNKNR